MASESLFCSAVRPAGDPTVSGGLWRGHRRPCTSRPHGEATGSGQPTDARDKSSSTCRASAGDTCSARGEQNRVLLPRMFQKPESSLTEKLPEIWAELSEHHSGHKEAGKGLAGIQPPGYIGPRETPQGWWAVLMAKPQVAISHTWSPSGTPVPTYPRPVSRVPGFRRSGFKPLRAGPQGLPFHHTHMELRLLPSQGS